MTISILGCGWLGLPLAQELVDMGHTVKGSTTTESKLQTLKEHGIEPFLLQLSPELEGKGSEAFFDADLLVLNVPPGRRRENVIKFHTAQIASVITYLKNSSVKRVVFASSTSVYPKTGGVMEVDDAREGSASRDSGEALIQAEKMLRECTSFVTTVVRFGGLYGYDRHPAKYLAGKEELSGGNAPVNLIHRDDAVRILNEIVGRECGGETFNGVSDGHPPRKQYYRVIAEQAGLEPPSFQPDSGRSYKVVSNRKLKERLDFRFKYPNPLDVPLSITE